jgi:type IV pilus assembly protein PilM
LPSNPEQVGSGKRDALLGGGEPSDKEPAMAKSDAVWGIDVGQCALKAIRCRPHEKPDRVVAEAFDYIEYPQILSQPGADPVELVRDALKLFLSRNSVRGDRIAISVPGQAGLARFIKLPPVEAKKIPDIVRFEARQQIPFDLKDVVWDYQRMEGGAEEEGFALETQIGLFAMKRDQVYKALEPFMKAGLDIDVVQLAPLALYNFLQFDELAAELPPPQEYDPESPPKSTVILSLGVDASDLVVTDGYRVWQRSLPVGGNHFTKALMKDLKLTFPKAEHLKRNATSAQDPKAVFQAMRPVFNDLLTEVQRSIGYFSSLDRNAEIERVVALGNAMKLPGLRKFLEQNLGLPMARIDAFQRLVGSTVVSAPAFQENLAGFGLCYGLALQGLGKGGLATNLLPREVVNERIIREKKPWAVAAAAVLLTGLTLSYASYAMALKTVSEERFSAAEQRSAGVSSRSSDFKRQIEEAKTTFTGTNTIGQHLVGNIEGRLLWMELLKAINQSLPSDPPSREPNKLPEVEQRNELHVTNLDAEWVPDLSQWFAQVQQWYQPGPGEKPLPAAAPTAGGAPADPNAAPPPEGAPPADGAAPADGQPKVGPQGPGWVITLRGRHYHNSETAGSDLGAQFVRKSFISKLQSDSRIIDLQTIDGKPQMVSMKELGVSYPVLRDPGRIEPFTITNTPAEGQDKAPGETTKKSVDVRKFDFVVQFAWQPKPPSVRDARRAAAAAAAANPQNAPNPPGAVQ